MSEELRLLQVQTFARSTGATAASYPPESRLTGPQLAEYLDRRAFAVVGSGRADGRPHAAMCAYLRRGSTFWLPMVSGSVRERNLRGQAWMTMTVTEGDRDAHVVVLMEGPTEVVAPSAVPDDVRDAFAGDWIASWIRFAPQRLLSYASPGVLGDSA